MSQERMAEFLEVDPRTLRRWESGEDPTPDDAMGLLADLVGSPYLLYRHYKEKYQIGDEILPAVEEASLSRAVCALLTELTELEESGAASRLLSMASDGLIDPAEKEDFAFIMAKLDGVRRAVETLRYSRKE